MKKSKGFNLNPELIRKLERLKTENSINLSSWVDKVLSKAVNEELKEANNVKKQ